MDKCIQVFISYIEEDNEYAELLYSSLSRMGVYCWKYTKNLKPGTCWEDKIKYEIEKSNFFLTICSKRSINKSGYYQAEQRIALDFLKKLPPGKEFIIPVTIDGAKPSFPELQKIDFINISQNFDDGLLAIIQTIQTDSTYSNQIGGPVSKTRFDVRLLFKCNNFKDSILFQNNPHWKQYLLPTVSYPDLLPENLVKDEVIKYVKHKYLIDEDIEILLTNRCSTTKLSKRLKIVTWYKFWHAIIDLDKNKQYCTYNKFKILGYKFEWISIDRCVSDKKIYSGNEESIDEIAKLFGIEFPHSKRIAR